MSEASRTPMTTWERTSTGIAVLGGLLVLATLPLDLVLSDGQMRVVFALEVTIVYVSALSVLSSRAFGCLETLVPILATTSVGVAWFADHDNTGTPVVAALAVGLVLWIAAHLLTRRSRRSA